MTTSTTPPALANDRITEFGFFVEAGRRLARIFETSLRDNHGLTMVEFEAMLRMGRSPELQMSMSELALQMVLTSGGVTRLVDRLTGKELVTRVSCPSDRRVQWAQLTEEGVKTAAAAAETHLEDLDRYFFSAMSPDERATLVPVLDRLRANCNGT